jgi:hypothetical protein
LPEDPAAETVLDEAVEQATGGHDSHIGDSHIGSLVTVISQLVTRLDVQQDQLNMLQAVVASAPPAVSHSSPVVPSQGAIPKRSCAQEALSGDNISLSELRADGALMSQATRRVDSLDLGVPGNSALNFPKTLKRSWARPGGGDNAPRIPIPWPQDFIISQGRKPRLLFDELDIHQFVRNFAGTVACHHARRPIPWV